MFRRQYIHSVQIGTYACPDIQNEPTKLVVTFQLIIILLPVQFGSNRFQTGSDYLRNLRTENRTEQRTERTRTEQNRTFGLVLSVLVLWISSELNFGNTNLSVLSIQTRSLSSALFQMTQIAFRVQFLPIALLFFLQS